MSFVSAVKCTWHMRCLGWIKRAWSGLGPSSSERGHSGRKWNEKVHMKFSLAQAACYSLLVPSRRPAAGLLSLSDSPTPIRNQQRSEPQISLMWPKATCLDALPFSQHVKQLGFMATFVKTVSLCSYCVTALNSRQNTFVIGGIKSSACGRLQSSLLRSKRLRLSFFQGAVDEPIISPFSRPPFLCSL